MREPIYPQTALEFFNKLLFYLYKIDIVTWKLRRSHEDNVELRDIGWKQPKRNNSRKEVGCSMDVQLRTGDMERDPWMDSRPT